MAPLHSQGCEGAAYPRLDTRLQSPEKTITNWFLFLFPPAVSLHRLPPKILPFRVQGWRPQFPPLAARLGGQGAPATRHLAEGWAREAVGGARKGQEKPGRATADALEVPDPGKASFGRGGRGGARVPKGNSNLLRIENSPLKIWAPPRWPNGMAQP